MEESYRVCVQGHLDDRWSSWFEGLAVHRQDDGTTLLVGPIGDQAALHGMFARIRDLGLALLSVNRANESDAFARNDARFAELTADREAGPLKT
jgi:hypothetical protein